VNRIQADLVHGKCYFGSRATCSIRILTLENHFPVTTLPVDFSALLPTVDLDFNRLVVSPSGESLLVFDRKGPYVILAVQILTSQPILSILHTPGSGLKRPLQGASHPIFPQENALWDCAFPTIPNDGETKNPSSSITLGLEKSLLVSPELSFAVAGSIVWMIPTRQDQAITLPLDLLPSQQQITPEEVNLSLQFSSLSSSQSKPHSSPDEDDDESAATLDPSSSYLPYVQALEAIQTPTLQLCDLSFLYPKFLIHEIIPLTSNTILLLNRHSHNTGLYQLTAKSSYGWVPATTTSTTTTTTNFHDLYELNYLIGHRYLAPHGMTLSLDRQSILIVETGSVEERGLRGGVINLMNLSLGLLENKVLISSHHKLEEILVPTIEGWNEKVKIGKDPGAGTGTGQSYESVYRMVDQSHDQCTPGGIGCKIS
jgi:hypothetical protein